MSGLFPSIANSQNVDENGRPLAGAQLSVFNGGTITLANTFQDIGLAIPANNPLIADDRGRIPLFYVADGTYRVRLLDVDGVVQYDYPGVASIGASASGGGGTAVDPAATFLTGMPFWMPFTGIWPGFVRMNGRTIGNATSGATERANADCQALFLFCWNNFADSICPVTTGRGATAAADWSAGKVIKLIDMRGLSPVGMASMGNTDSGILNNVTFSRGDRNTAASLMGEALHVLVKAELAAHDHTGDTDTNGQITFGDFGGVLGGESGFRNMSTDTSLGDAPVFDWAARNGQFTIPENTFRLAIFPDGSNLAHNNMQPGMTGTYFQRL